MAKLGNKNLGYFRIFFIDSQCFGNNSPQQVIILMTFYCCRYYNVSIILEMDENIAIVPSKHRKTETNYELSIICQQDAPNETLVTNPNVESVETLLTVIRECYQYGDTSVDVFAIRTKDLTAQEI